VLGLREASLAYLEQLLGDVVVGAFREVTAANVVSSAEVDTQVHILRALEALVVELDIGVEHLVGCLVVLLVRSPALQHVLGAEVRQVRVVDLDVPDALRVQDLELLLVCLCYIRKVFLVVRVHLLGEATAVQVAEVVPARGDQGDLDVLPFALGEEALHQIDFVLVTRLSGMADLVDANSDVVGNLLGLHEGLDVRCVGAEDARIVALQNTELKLLHTVQRLEESSPKHVPCPH
jgi:hypothetical protein